MNNKILIVDDDQSFVRLVSLKLKDKGYQTFAAFDGYQGIKMTHEVMPDLILLDLEMPAGNGVETFEKLKKSNKTSSIPIFVITGISNKEVKELIITIGADGFFQKPINFTELIKKMELVLQIS